jgi:asparagine synthase (glutamine-hydrolysing)
MCGIIGIAGLKGGSKASLEASIASLSRRGPDDRGIVSFSAAILGHTRLAVIDLSEAGHQPMKDSAAENTIVFNGEIFNYRALRQELEKKGHSFVSHSDTEVILKAYAQWGEACPEHLDGQFAFAIWDEKNKKLFLARDPFGEKPLYTARASTGEFLFASEIKALFATGLVSNEIDPVSLDNYLALLYVPPWRSIYKHITPLKPAHSATFKDGAYTEKRYWALKKNPLHLSIDEAAAQTRELLHASVASRMVADIEVGAFLSGGIDSGLVVRLAQQASDKKIKTFSAGFEDTINELPFAKEVAVLAGTQHTEAQIHEDLAQTFLQISSYFDEPFGDSSNIPTSLIAKLAQEKVKVALSGDGGDELFWGYGQYTRYRHLPKMQMLFNFVTGKNAFDYYRSSILTHFNVSERRALFKDSGAIEADPTVHIDYSEASTPLEKINVTDFYMGLPGDMLAKVDRSSMMHSLEVRSPFLNPALAQFAYNLPAEYKTDGRRGKIILEKAFGDLLPPGFFSRKKQGFGAPVGVWLRKPEFKKLVDEWFGSDAHIGAWLNIDEVRSYAERFYAGENNLQYKLWNLLALEAWARTRII